MASDAVSQFGIPLQGEPPAAFERRDRARSVSADLEAIFGEPTSTEAPPRAQPVGPGLRRQADTAPRRLSAATIGGLAAAALVGIAAGSLLVKIPHPSAAPAAAPALPRPDALPVEMAQTPQTPQAIDAEAAAPDTPAVVSEAPPRARGEVHSQPRLHAPAKVRRATAPDVNVRAADHRLRAAYAAAIRAGAPRDLLADNRDRWASVRRRQAHDPARLAASYNAIAADLNRAALHSHARAPRRSLFHTRFASWWR